MSPPSSILFTPTEYIYANREPLRGMYIIRTLGLGEKKIRKSERHFFSLFINSIAAGMRESVIKVPLGTAHLEINMRDKIRSETKTLQYYIETIDVYEGLARYFVSVLNINIYKT